MKNYYNNLIINTKKKLWDCFKINQLYTLLVLFCCGIVYFEFVGQIGAIEFDDSAAYLAPNIWQGIMPIYHLFIKINSFIFGGCYLQATAIIQGILATICTCVFTGYITKCFCLNYYEMPIVWFCTLLPYSVEMPQYVNTHVIFTEGIAYSFYYIFFIISFSYVLSKKHTILLYTMSFLAATFMALIRPQLLLLFLIVGLISMYKLFITPLHLITRIIFAILGLCLTVGSGVMLTYGVRTAYIGIADRIYKSDLVEQTAEYDVINVLENPVPRSYDVTNDNDDEVNYSAEEYLSQQSGDQLSRIIAMRGIYLADYDDYKLYSNQSISAYFGYVQKVLYDKKLLYMFNPGGLYGWRHIADTRIYDLLIDSMVPECIDYEYSKYIWENLNIVLLEIGITEILHHPIRFIYYSIILFVPGFISTVFFNIQRIYLFCHVYTALIYIFAILFGINFHKKKYTVIIGKFTLYSIICNCVFVCVTNLMFFGMQRYFLYVFGIFYCAIYLVIRTQFLQRFKRRTELGEV